MDIVLGIKHEDKCMRLEFEVTCYGQIYKRRIGRSATPHIFSY